MAEERRDSDLVLSPGVFAHVLALNKGTVSVCAGPTSKTLSTQTHQTVLFDPKTGRFENVDKNRAIQNNVKASKGQYVILSNPSKTTGQPKAGATDAEVNDADLRIGEVENLPGPQFFALWPSQTAEVLDGHQIRTNQYLVVRIVDDVLAAANWEKTVVKTTDGEGLNVDTKKLYTGQLIVIDGTKVSFYIPPTGVEVLRNGSSVVSNARPQASDFVREAVTLESLEYCILLDEQGDKRYVQGPDVVFPEPTEKFVADEGGKVKFQLYELTELSGIHIKVISEYKVETTAEQIKSGKVASPWSLTDASTKDRIDDLIKGRLGKDGEKDVFKYEAGDELFVTGIQMPLYMPLVNHSIIKYDGRTRYHAVWIPKGQARYVVNRLTADVQTIHGPEMLLLDPRYEVFTRRILSDAQCNLYYPGNQEALAVNRMLATLIGKRSGAGDGSRGVMRAANLAASAMDLMDAPASYAYKGTGHLESSVISTRTRQAQLGGEMAGDSIDRGGKFTPPRELLGDSTFDGALLIKPWTGYAVQVVDSKGKRRTVKGPANLVLEYDEDLQGLALSKGTPKSADTGILPTAYLKYECNSVSDEIKVSTKDLVDLTIPIKFLIRFDGDPDRWFSVANYVQHLVDHIRGMVQTFVRGYNVEEFFFEAPTLVREFLLGPKDETTGERPLRTFKENGMTIYDCTIGDVEIEDQKVDTALRLARSKELQNSLELEASSRELAQTTAIQENVRRIEAAKHETRIANVRLLIAGDEAEDRRKSEAQDRRIVIEQTEQEALATAKKAEQAMEEIQNAISMARDAVVNKRATEAQVLSIQMIEAEAKAIVERFGAIQPDLVATLQLMAQQGILKEIAPNLAPLALVRDESVVGVFRKIVAGTGLEKIVDNMQSVGGTARSLPPGK